MMIDEEPSVDFGTNLPLNIHLRKQVGALTPGLTPSKIPTERDHEEELKTDLDNETDHK